MKSQKQKPRKGLEEKTRRNKNLKEGKSLVLKGDKKQEYVAILMKKSKRAQSNKQCCCNDPQQKITQSEGFSGVGPFPKGKQPENPKNELMSGHSPTKDMTPPKKNNPNFCCHFESTETPELT